MRVNARFEGVAEKQVEYLTTMLDTSISEVLRLSVDQYYTALRGQNPRELRFLSKHIGKGDSGLNLSGAYQRGIPFHEFHATIQVLDPSIGSHLDFALLDRIDDPPSAVVMGWPVEPRMFRVG